MLRADAAAPETARQYLTQLREGAPPSKTVQLRGPVPAPVERRADRHRFQLAVFSSSRPALHRMLTALLAQASKLGSSQLGASKVGASQLSQQGPSRPRPSQLPGTRGVKFSLDVDPVDIF